MVDDLGAEQASSACGAEHVPRVPEDTDITLVTSLNQASWILLSPTLHRVNPGRDVTPPAPARRLLLRPERSSPARGGKPRPEPPVNRTPGIHCGKAHAGGFREGEERATFYA